MRSDFLAANKRQPPSHVRGLGMGREKHYCHMQSGYLVSYFPLGSNMSSPGHPGSNVQLSAAPVGPFGKDHTEALVPVFRQNPGQPLAFSRLFSKWAVKWLVQVPTAGIWPSDWL